MDYLKAIVDLLKTTPARTPRSLAAEHLLGEARRFEARLEAGDPCDDVGAFLVRVREWRETRDAGLPECQHGHKHYCGHCGPVV